MRMNSRERLAWNLRALRVAQGLSQERLAADAGIDRAYVGGIERQTENPTIDLLERLATALKVDIPALLTLPVGDAPPAPLRGGRPRRVS